MVNSKWLSDFSYDYSTGDIRYQDNNIYSKFSKSGYQGGFMMVNIMLDQMLFMSNDVVTVLKTFLEKIAKKLVFSINHILTVCGCLSEV